MGYSKDFDNMETVARLKDNTTKQVIRWKSLQRKIAAYFSGAKTYGFYKIENSLFLQ